ncbi:MAG: hypothetical protein QXM12_07590 [Nitrososphaerota archaeon]
MSEQTIDPGIVKKPNNYFRTVMHHMVEYMSHQLNSLRTAECITE